MSVKVDVSIAFYGKPYQAIVTIKSLLKHSRQHIDKIYLSRQRQQPHDDYIGIFKVIDYFKNDDVNLVVHYPYHAIGAGVMDYERAKNDTRFRQSIMYQYALEVTDKKYLCLMHNDLLFHGDMIGDMLKTFSEGPRELVGVGPVGQCWSCPAGPSWANKCGPERYDQYVPSMEEAIALTESHSTPRKDIQLNVIRNGRVHILPECRLNEFCAMIDVEKYRKETLPNGPIGCFGGVWHGSDTGTIWSHDMVKRGYKFKHMTLENYARHAPFESSGSGTSAYFKSDTYWQAEQRAKEYIEKTFGPLNFSAYVPVANTLDTLKRKSWLLLINTVGFAKKIVGKG
ncbi:hypothetical protein [Telluribacter sp. SYSU D00476]|uniref:hypothetical protein n=1 Tax=Telluribacter sp. SYSU D00476 TaxID=2811430 RepID=UPI001FF434D0|nr:hypothetical protein [Telluribacter sp. SYSU D00476]